MDSTTVVNPVDVNFALISSSIMNLLHSYGISNFDTVVENSHSATPGYIFSENFLLELQAINSCSDPSIRSIANELAPVVNSLRLALEIQSQPNSCISHIGQAWVYLGLLYLCHLEPSICDPAGILSSKLLLLQNKAHKTETEMQTRVQV